MKRRLLVALGILLGIVVVVFAVIGVLTVTRGTPVNRVLAIGDTAGPPPVTDSLFARTMELFTGTHIYEGNRVEVTTDGNSTYPQLWRDIDSARRTVTVQMYYSQPGRMATMMKDHLIGRARAGVRVLFLMDAFGSQNLTPRYADSLRRAGVHVAYLRALHWYTLNKASLRSHVRVVVVDGRVGWTGGFGLADYWFGDGHHPDQWRDSNVRFEGPAVMELQAAFADAWAEATGVLLTGDVFFPHSGFQHVGPVAAGLLFTEPSVGSTSAERFLALTIAAARHTLYITNSYFVPDDDFQRLLEQDAQRGVDVRVLTAGQNSDVKTTLYAGRARYEALLRAGVRIYEYQPSMLHAKSIVVDSTWSEVGSMNFDNRSLAFNNESNLLMLDPHMGAVVDSIFFDDLRYSKEIELARFRQRGFKERALEWGSALLSRVL